MAETTANDIQNELTVTQIETRQGNNIISYIESELNRLEKSLLKEENIKSEKRFLDEFKNFKRVTSQKDVYGPFIYYTLYELQKEIELVKEFLDKDSSFNTDIVIPYVESRYNEENMKSSLVGFFHSLRSSAICDLVLKFPFNVDSCAEASEFDLVTQCTKRILELSQLFSSGTKNNSRIFSQKLQDKIV